MNIRRFDRVSAETRNNANVNASYIGFRDRLPVVEIDHMDGKWWSRPYGAANSVPFSPCFAKSLRELASELANC